ncbi:hypothetical protein [Thermogutta sp.]|uniref:hypothetical protein n=1 Tax=Thermogutta sp. TaxID=1962930 RepID=UPI00321FFC00
MYGVDLTAVLGRAETPTWQHSEVEFAQVVLASVSRRLHQLARALWLAFFRDRAGQIAIATMGG